MDKEHDDPDSGREDASALVPTNDEEKIFAGGLAAAFAARRRGGKAVRASSAPAAPAPAPAGSRPEGAKKGVVLTIPTKEAEAEEEGKKAGPQRKPSLTTVKLAAISSAAEAFRQEVLDFRAASVEEGDEHALEELAKAEEAFTRARGGQDGAAPPFLTAPDFTAKRWATNVLPVLGAKGYHRTLERFLRGPLTICPPEAICRFAATDSSSAALFTALEALDKANGSGTEDKATKDAIARCAALLLSVGSVRQALCGANRTGAGSNTAGSHTHVHDHNRAIVRRRAAALVLSNRNVMLVEALFEALRAAGLPVELQTELLESLAVSVERADDDAAFVSLFCGPRSDLPLLRGPPLYRLFRLAVTVGSFDVANRLLFSCPGSASSRSNRDAANRDIIEGLQSESPRFSTILAACLNGMTVVVRACLLALIPFDGNDSDNSDDSNSGGNQKRSARSRAVERSLIANAPGRLAAAFMALVKTHNASDAGRRALKKAITAARNEGGDEGSEAEEKLSPLLASFFPQPSVRVSTGKRAVARTAALATRAAKNRSYAGRMKAARTKLSGKPWAWTQEAKTEEAEGGRGKAADGPGILTLIAGGKGKGGGDNPGLPSLRDAFTRRFGGGRGAEVGAAEMGGGAAGSARSGASAATSDGSSLPSICASADGAEAGDEASDAVSLSITGKAIPLLPPVTQEEEEAAAASLTAAAAFAEDEGAMEDGKQGKEAAAPEPRQEKVRDDEEGDENEDERGQEQDEEDEEVESKSPPAPPYRFQVLAKPQRQCFLALLELCPLVFTSAVCSCLHPEVMKRRQAQAYDGDEAAAAAVSGYIPVPLDAAEESCRISPLDQHLEDEFKSHYAGAAARRHPHAAQQALPVPAPVPITKLYLPLDVRDDITCLLGEWTWRRRAHAATDYYYAWHPPSYEDEDEHDVEDGGDGENDDDGGGKNEEER